MAERKERAAPGPARPRARRGNRVELFQACRPHDSSVLEPPSRGGDIASADQIALGKLGRGRV